MRLFIVGWLVLLAIVVTVGYVNDRDSCRRSNGVRSGLYTQFSAQGLRAGERAAIDHGAAEKLLDLQAQASAVQAANTEKPLDCSALFPGTTR